uniref:Tubulin folding cofactor E n=1 Tax=Dicentrarchus labrax TaxID=13489 RepID=A0A8C4F263_DICLA
MSELKSVPADAVGRRVSCGGERATVRYGSVVPVLGLWKAVSCGWPLEGSVALTVFNRERMMFKMRLMGSRSLRHPKGGSFVRPAKVSYGVDYLTAVQQEYQIDSEEVLREEISISSKKLKWLAVEERSLETLPSVLLTRSDVNGPGADGEIRKTTPNVQWLDLSGTLLSCWEDVSAISQQLDQLNGLQLSNNRLRFPSDPSAHLQAFGSLRVLVLNSCDLTWPQILECAPMWPQLEDLSVQENNITELQRPDGVLQSLKSLSLSSNPLVQETVLSIAALSRCVFIYIEFYVVDELAKLCSLVQFSCRRNKLASSDGNPKTADQLLIAKLGGLEVLNGSKVHPEDRKGAELDYIKMFGEDWLKAGGGAQPGSEFTCQHPRYLSLIHKYGAPEEGELRKPKPFALKNQLLKITFVCPDDGERKPIEKKLPASMEVQKVKGLLYRLLKVPAADLKLTYTSLKKVGTEFEIDSDLKTLQFYSIEDGDQVLVRWS